jgi:hypothetical protein
LFRNRQDAREGRKPRRVTGRSGNVEVTYSTINPEPSGGDLEDFPVFDYREILRP